MSPACNELSLLTACVGLLVLHYSALSSVATGCGTTGDVRLADQVSEYEGRVEVCYDGTWATVCDHHWGSSDAMVVCRQLGLPTAYPDALLRFGGGSGLYFAGFRCRGSETQLVRCSAFSGVCDHSEDAGVRCLSDPCTEDEVRVNGNVVQVCHDSQWGLVCASSGLWDTEAARMVCQQAEMPSRDPRPLHIQSPFLQLYDAPVTLNASCLVSEERCYGEFADCSSIAAVYCEALEPCSDPEAIRLTHTQSDIPGRLEVCSGGRWGTVCGIGVTNALADVVCRQLNHAADGRVHVEDDFHYILRVVPIALTNVTCNGRENTLSECLSDEIDANQSCGHGNDVLVSCVSRECTETDIRLVGGRTPYDGRVEVCLDGQWGSVCDDKWDFRDAAVVCRQLGYNGTSHPLHEHSNNANNTILHLDDVDCYGNESKLSECKHRGIGINNCAMRPVEAGVICTNVTCEDGTVHLVGGDTISRGRVEYCYNGSWYSVCANGWNEQEATVVCNTLSYDTTTHVSVVSSFGRGTSPILSQSIQCTSNDTTLHECARTDQDQSQCQHVAGVICEAPCLSNGFTDCDNCSTGCVVSDHSCSCRSDCYEAGDCCPDVSHVQNCLDKGCETGEVRLVGGVTNSSGRLEVCGNGVWGNVCNYLEYWGPDNAAVVCHQLGFSEVGAFVVAANVFGPVSGRIVVGEVHCTGTETELLECSHDSIGDHLCGPPLKSEDDVGVAISCYDENSSCKYGEVRLQDGTDPSNGRVEVCQYRTWGSVCTSQWDHNDARVVCKQLGYDPEDTRAMEGFGAAEAGPVFLSEVECTGTEEKLTMCHSVGVGSHTCRLQDSAGVTCGKSAVSRCEDESGTPPMTQNTVTDEERFGRCEAYTGGVTVCDGVVNSGTDFVYIPKSHGTQSNMSALLNNRIRFSLFDTHNKDCVEQVFRIICRYYLPPCGTITQTIPPSSVCQEECAHVQSSCATTWQLAEFGFKPNPFIYCDDASQLLSPLPNCCTGAGIKVLVAASPTPYAVSDRQSSGIEGRTIAGVVTGTLSFFVAVAIIVMILFMIISRKLRRKKLLQRIQLDILAMPGSDPPIFRNTSTVYGMNSGATAGVIEPDEKNIDLPNGANAEPNLYSVPRPANDGRPSVSSYLGVNEKTTLTRVNSHTLRELSLAKLIIKYEELSQLDNIGQGEFGIVYRARLGPHGRYSQEVAVKTLKGDFDQLDVDKFVEESLKMSRFRHPHVMGLVGVCLDAGSAPYIVMPYMANGSLLQYLRKERKNLVFSEDADKDEVEEVRKRLMVMCSQIASGMEYLAAEKYIHRDLAARNCMIDSHFVIKITDFGLSEDVFLRNYFRQGGDREVVKLPVKWMAPESLSDGHFSEKSDVWSYGVTMWEIFSGGKAPYPGTDPLTLVQRLEEGDRMPKPNNAACTEAIYKMMRKCWEMVPDDRPSFEDLHANTSKYTEHIAGYLEMGFNPFASGNRVKSTILESEDVGFESAVAIQVTPASLEEESVDKVFTD